MASAVLCVEGVSH